MGKKRMRTGVVRAFGTPLSIEEMPIPTPGPGEVLIKVAGQWGLSHRSSCRQRRLAGEPFAAVCTRP
jgi:Zn-dependent alcohol dehydrogenase